MNVQLIVVHGWFVLFGAGGVVLAMLLEASAWNAMIVLATYALADAGSYIFHYIVDHYGDAAKDGIVREFQNHHRQPGCIARRPLVEVIYPAARIIALPVLVVLLLALAGWLSGPWALFLFTLGSCWVFTQVFHRWAHLRRPGRVVASLQRSGLILARSPHERHHESPFMTNFAVINGWSNPLFDTIGMPGLVDIVLEKGLGIEKRSTLVADVAAMQLENRQSV